ncbi:MAG TPA: hypothetical protein VGC15_14160 [Acetobacteraceae bacterium]
MRKFLLTLAVLAGAVAATSGADAAPRTIPLVAAPAADGAALVQPVQYYPGWRYREARRREAYEHFRRHEARREWRREHGFYGRRYGYGYGPRY